MHVAGGWCALRGRCVPEHVKVKGVCTEHWTPVSIADVWLHSCGSGGGSSGAGGDSPVQWLSSKTQVSARTWTTTKRRQRQRLRSCTEQHLDPTNRRMRVSRRMARERTARKDAKAREERNGKRTV